MTRDHGRPVVAIVGGGFTGAAVAFHLARAVPDELRTVIIEPRETLGAGLAYSTADPAHRINVPAARMSLESGDPEQFARWLQASGLPVGDPAAFDARGVFPQRRVFATYVASMLAPDRSAGRIEHVRDRAADVSREEPDDRFRIALEHGGSVTADVLVLATTHPVPAVPPPLRTIAASRFFVADPYDADRLSRIDPAASILVVGNGLTAADMVVALDGRGHHGPIAMLSRNGLRSRGHASSPREPFGDFSSDPSPTALALLRNVRHTIEQADSEGMSWHAVIDAVRNQGTSIWQALPASEQRTLVRRLRVFWDVHRFRVAPQVEAALDRLAAAKRLRTLAATLRFAVETPVGGVEVGFRRRYANQVETETFDAVVNTTGPAHCSVVETAPARSLRDAGLIRLDAVGLGLATAPDGQAIDASGSPVPGLYVAGPLARGTFGELMGLPDVTRYAEFVAAQIAAELPKRGYALR